MRYGSVCSGVEAASLAWLQLGWECKFVAEVEPFPCAVLQQRFGATAPIHPLDPAEATNEKDRKMRISWMKQNELLKKEGSIPNEGDFTKIGKKYAGQIDLLVGGTPCQDLSVAGKRAGFDGERSSLAIDFVRLAYESQCKWVVWENVPGVFSSNGGRDFATLLSLFVGREITVPARGWSSAGFVCNDRADRFGLAWRVLDAQFTRTPGFPFAIPQRRRRVFLVGYFGDWSRAAEVLLEPGRMSWDTPPRFKAWERFAGIAQGCLGTASTVRMRSGCEGGGKGALVSNEVSLTLAAGSNDQTLFTADRPWDNSGVNPTLTQCGSGSGTIGASNQELFAQNYNGLVMSIGNGQPAEASIMMKECCQTLNCMHDQQAVLCINGQVSNDGINCAFCFQQNTRDEVRYINGDGAIAGALSAESGMKQTNYICYENHANDSRITESNEVSPLISSQSGTGGGNLPLVQECYVKTAKPTFKGGCETYADTGVAPTVNTFDQGDKRANELVVTSEVFAIDSLSSNSMKSSNPHSGFHKEEIAKTLDTTIPSPTKNQGGNIIIENSAVAIAENIIGRKVENGGNGIGAQEELAYTQNATGVMGVCQSSVRRLLPVECERLMGFPDNHTRIAWKGKTEEQCPDGPRYKACGNSMCVNCMEYIGRQIQKNEEIQK